MKIPHLEIEYETLLNSPIGNTNIELTDIKISKIKEAFNGIISI